MSQVSSIKAEIQSNGDPKVQSITRAGLLLASHARLLGTVPERRHREVNEYGKLDLLRTCHNGKI